MDAKTLCLGVLSRRDSSGYQIRKEFESGSFAEFQQAGFGSIYPALKRLTDEGLATCVEHEQDSRPDKKVYRITPAGRQALFEAVHAPPGEDRLRSDFLFVLSFADLLPISTVDTLLAERVAFHRRAIATLQKQTAGASRPTEAFVHGYTIAMHEAAIAFFESRQHELLGGLIRRQVAE